MPFHQMVFHRGIYILSAIMSQKNQKSHFKHCFTLLAIYCCVFFLPGVRNSDTSVLILFVILGIIPRRCNVWNPRHGRKTNAAACYLFKFFISDFIHDYYLLFILYLPFIVLYLKASCLFSYGHIHIRRKEELSTLIFKI